MIASHTNSSLASLALIKTITDLFVKGHYPFIPVHEYHLCCDLMVLTNDNKVYKLQIKHSTAGLVRCKKTKYNGQQSNYSSDDLDYYAIYLPSVDKVIYPSIKFSGCTIATTHRMSFVDFYWYEDFISFTDIARKRNYSEFNYLKEDIIKANSWIRSDKRYHSNKPSKQELEDIIWKIPASELAKKYSVSDTTIARWCKSYQIKKPNRGYWTPSNVFVSEEKRLLLSQSQHHKKKPISIDGVIYPSVCNAAKELNLHKGTIRYRLRSKYNKQYFFV